MGESKFGALRTVRKETPPPPIEATVEPVTATPARPEPVAMAVVPTRGRPAGKRSNPDYEPTTLFLRKATKRTANRMLEDLGIEQDLSELIEELLQRWVSARP